MNREASTPRILIVDNDPGTLCVSQKLFKLHGYDTSAALCPEEAIEAYATTLPDAVILEWSFRNGLGVGLTTRLRERALQRGRTVVIVIFSVLEEPEGFQANESYDDYFVKPACLTAIAHRIGTLLQMQCPAHAPS